MLEVAASLHTAGTQFSLYPSGEFSFLTPWKWQHLWEGRLKGDRAVQTQDLNATSGELPGESSNCKYILKKFLVESGFVWTWSFPCRWWPGWTIRDRTSLSHPGCSRKAFVRGLITERTSLMDSGSVGILVTVVLWLAIFQQKLL